MQPGKYEYKTEFVRNLVAERERHRLEGRMEGFEEGRRENARALLLQVAERRLGRVGDELRAAIAACQDAELLDALVVEVAAAPDGDAGAKALARLTS